jgi:hypothetical protein
MTDYTAISHRLHKIIDEHAFSTRWLPAIAALRPSPLRPTQEVAPGGTQRNPKRRATVSVVIPCYNYGRYLRGAVESALSQEAVDVQVVIVNDRSPDDTAEVADRLAASDHRVEVIHNKENLGHVRTFNRGLEHVDGDFLVRLDADDLLTPGCLAGAVELFDCSPSIGLVYGHPYHFETTEPPTPRITDVSWTIWSGPEWLAERCRVGVNCITTPEAMLRTSVVREVGPLDTRLRFAQDMEMWCRVAAVSNVGRVNGSDQALHRDHPDSMSATEGSPAIVDLRERRQVFASVFESTGSALPNALALHNLAREALARESIGYAERALDAGESTAASRFIEFAEEMYPSALESGWPAGVVRRSFGLARPSPMRKIRRRLTGLAHEIDYVRWAVYGI